MSAVAKLALRLGVQEPPTQQQWLDVLFYLEELRDASVYHCMRGCDYPRNRRCCRTGKAGARTLVYIVLYVWRPSLIDASRKTWLGAVGVDGGRAENTLRMFGATEKGIG
jgi:hypothetical protein